MLMGTGPDSLARTSAARKQEAANQFEKAEQMREALNGRPEAERTRRDYQRVVDAYRKVYYVASASSKADASVVAAAELLAEMGRQFQPGEKDLQSAIREYEFLQREYPSSKYRFQALFTIGQIYTEDLGDDEAARKTFEDFLIRYPRNSLAPEAKRALAELNQPKTKKKPVEEAHAQPAEVPVAETFAPPTAPKKSGLTMVTGVRHWSTPDYTRVAIDVDREVKYEVGRVSGPDRIFFDLPDTKLSSVLVGKSFDVQDGFLKKIRVAQYHPGSTRVVLEVADVSDYSAFLLPNPYRLIIDIHGRQGRSPTQAAKSGTPVGSEDEDFAPSSGKSSSPALPAKAVGTSSLNTKAPPASASKTAGGNGVTVPATATAASGKPVAVAPLQKVVVDEDAEVTKGDLAAGSRATQANAQSSKSAGNNLAASPPAKGVGSLTDGTVSADKANKPSGTTTARAPNSNDPLSSASGGAADPGLKAMSQPTTAPTAVEVAPRTKASKSKKTSTAAAVEAPSTHEAAPTSAGDRSLTRALGLKIGRIVIDAGHGGHDTGTIGPNGLMEKDLVLDVALRLGRLLETRLGADVIYTRDDDTFVPLETRTAIANEHQADLFISVHANSSHDPSARGIETYYLNFTTNADALEVAARENAVSEKSVFELQDLVKKITLKDKIEESRELASDVQQSLYSGLAGKHSTLRDRGVKKAPFVVLIGANMPSILAEISFVSNPTDATKLETPEYRQKIADAMYKGIAHYAGGLSGVKVAAKFTKTSGE